MPRIDPIQLLNCLSVLLSPNGGIKSRDEVQRLAVLMTKFSKKLVSKCIYIQILKCTETELLGSFMGSGGWILVHMWLTESIVAKNWPLVKELLELLLLCPVDIERLKTNNCPKLVKELSKDGNYHAIRALASKLVEQWLKTVKGESVTSVKLEDIPKIISDAHYDTTTETKPEFVEVKKEPSDIHNELNNELEEVKKEIKSEDDEKTAEHVEEKYKQDQRTMNKSEPIDSDEKSLEDSGDNKQDILPVLKISLKDGNKVVSKVDESKQQDDSESTDSMKKNKDKSKDKSSSSKSNSTSSKHSSKSHSSSSDKHKSDRHRSGSSSSSNSSSRHNSSKDGSKDKDRHSSHSSKSKSDSKSKKSGDKSHISSSKSKEESGKSSERDKSKERRDSKSDRSKDDSSKSKDKTDEKSQTPSIHKLGKIPKIGDMKKEKPSISIEVRKPDEPKPKTVKTFNSKFRKHGLEEEIKPPPSRASLLNKKTPPVLPSTLPIPPPKRPSPVHNETPPEKKIKTVENIEKPGAIKLIPPKPKPMMLLESDMFMDALNASATNKKEPKKRKRRTSGSKDGNNPSDSSPPQTPTVLNSPNSDSKSVPPRFYQDTLEADEIKKESLDTSERKDTDNEEESVDEMEVTGPHTLTVNGLKGVLCYHKRKGPKKSIKWKPDSELEEIQYFELDETERVNVTKTFTDMKHLERINEREAFQKARNLINDDIMEEKTVWKPLIPINLDGHTQVEYGKNSKEKDIQAIRQKATLQPLYFHKSMIPDSPCEPDPETHTYSEPLIIPLNDIAGNQDNVADFRNMPWPEPKGQAPPTPTLSMPAMFPPNITQFPNGFPNPQFPGVPGVPGFQAPIVPNEWQNGIPPMINPMAPGGLAPGAIPPGNIPPNMMMPPNENMMMGPEMFGAPNPMFSVPPEGFPMQQNMFPMDFNMGVPTGPVPDGFSAPGNFRGAMRGRGAPGGHWRGKTPGNWDNSQRGRGGARGGRKTVCIYFQRKGSCRQGDNCSFLHPGVNCPY